MATSPSNSGSFFTKFLYVFFLLFHLHCFIFTDNHHRKPTKKRIASHLSPSCLFPSRFKPHKALSSSWSCIKRVLSTKTCKTSTRTHPNSPPTPTFLLPSARSSQQSLISMIAPETYVSDPPREKPSESDISADTFFFPLRNDIFPCTACGEIFHKAHFLEQHQAIKHAVTELIDGDSGKNIVRIIFKTGWRSDKEQNPETLRILKIHNSQKILSRFEEYREIVKSIAALNGAVKRRDERCIADGNELLRFYCTTFMCDLGLNGTSSICNQQYCNVCGIIKSGFSSKLDGISTFSSSWRAHVAIPEEIEEEFKFMSVKRAMLVCRVVAGRVGCDSEEEVDKEDGGFDSVVGRSVSGVHTRVDEEELLVFNPRAVLPCFVIVYTTV